MSKKEIDRRFHFPHRGKKNQCPKCAGLLEWCAQAGPMPPSIHCTACGFRDWELKGMKIDHDLLGSMARGYSCLKTVRTPNS